MYASVAYGDGKKFRILLSTDEGETWSTVNQTVNGVTYYADSSPQTIQVNPNDSQQIFYMSTYNTATAGNFWHLLFSKDGGATWELRGDEEHVTERLEVTWGSSSEDLLAGRVGGTTSNVVMLAGYSVDAGANWTDITGDWWTSIGSYKGAAGSSANAGVVSVVVPGAPIPDRSVNDSIVGPCPAPAAEANPTVGKPINPRTGGYDFSVEDLSIPTSAGPLAFRRTYSTQAVSLDTALLGSGWTHNLDTRLVFPEDPGGLEGWVLFKANSTNRYQFRIELEDPTDPNNPNKVYIPYPGLCASLMNNGTEYVLTDTSQNVYYFKGDNDSGKGLLDRYSDPQGHKLHYHYDDAASNRLDKVMDDVEFTNTGQGRYIVLAYVDGSSFRLSSAQDHAGRGVTFNYDGDLLSSVVDVMDKTWTYHYDDQTHPNFLTAVEDPLGDVVEATAFDSNGRAIRQYEGGEYLQFNYQGPNPVVTLSYSLGVTTVTEQGVTTTYTYDHRGTLVRKAHANDVAVNKAYDANFRPNLFIDPLGRATWMNWSADGKNLLKNIDAAGNVTRMTYNNLSRMTSKTDGRTHTTLYTYNGTLLESSTDALSKTTHYTYTTATQDVPGGLLETVENPEGGTVSYTYTPFGQKETVTDAAGLVTTYHYNDLGLVYRVDYPQGRQEWTCYDNAGRAVRSLSTYPEAPMPEAAACDPNPAVPLAYAERLHETKYDDAGKAVASIEWWLENGTPVSRITRTFYDDFGRVRYVVRNASDLQASIETLQANSTNEQNLISETAYDAYGRIIATIDPLGIITRTYYDSLGRPEFVLRNFVSANISDPRPAPGQLYSGQNVTSQTVYDAAGNAIASVDWWMEDIDVMSRTTRFYFDDLNRPVTVVQKLSGQEITDTEPPERDPNQMGPSTVNVRTDTYYDANGNVIATIDPLGVINRTFYDALNRPTLALRNMPGPLYTGESEPLESAFGNTTNVASRTEYDDAGRAIITRVWWRTASDVLRSRATRTFYDDFGRVQYTVQNVSDPQADIITLLANRTNEQNLISETRYDDYGRAFVTIDPLDRATRTYYDAQGRTQYVVRNCSDLAPGSQQPPDYDPLQPDRNVRTETIYDAAGRAIATRDTLGHTTRTYFDALDRSIRVVRNFASADLNILLPAYDPQHPDLYVRSETDYNAAGQVVATRDALGREKKNI